MEAGVSSRRQLRDRNKALCLDESNLLPQLLLRPGINDGLREEQSNNERSSDEGVDDDVNNLERLVPSKSKTLPFIRPHLTYLRQRCAVHPF